MPTAAAVPPEIAELSRAQQRNFESDFLRAAAARPEVRKAARRYFAFGWRAHYDAVSGHRRRRKAAGECRLRGCRCTCHSAVTVTDVVGLDNGQTADPATCQHDFQPTNGRELWCHKCGTAIAKEDYNRMLRLALVAAGTA